MNEQKSNNNPASKSQAVREDILERLHRGEAAYERDMTALAQELELMNRLHQHSEVGWLFMTMGALELYRGHFVAAYDYVMSALPYATQTGDKVRVVETLCSLGEINRRWGKIDEAHDFFTKAKDLAIALENVQLMALVQSNMGLLSLARKNPEQALGYFEEALEHIKPLPKTPSTEDILARTYYGLAETRLEMGEFLVAWELARRSLEIAAMNAHANALGTAYRTLGIIACKAHLANEMTDEQPSGYFSRSKELFRLSDARADLARTLTFEGKWLLSRQQRKDAIDAFTEAETLLNQVKLYDEALAVRRLRDS